MSKFTDRLKRLHSSRVRALSEDESPDEPRVFVADPLPRSGGGAERSEAGEAPRGAPLSPPASGGKPEQSEGEEAPTSPEREAVRASLELGQRIGRRPKKLKMKREASRQQTSLQSAERERQASSVAPTTRGRAAESENPIGERITVLRIQAQALVEAGRRDAAVDLLHEILALSPTHTFALTELATHARSNGDHAVAELYESRLKAVAPY